MVTEDIAAGRGGSVSTSGHRRTPTCGGGPSPARLGLSFSAGVGLFFLLPGIPPWWLPGLLLALALAALVPLRRPGWLLAALAFGLFWAHLHSCTVLCRPFPEPLAKRTLLAEGRVASLPERRPDSLRFLYRIDRLSVDGDEVDFRGLVRLSWYRDPPPLAAGARWRLAVRLKPPHGFLNPGGFDYERWLFQQRIAATGHVRAGSGNARLDPGPGPYWLTRWRQHLHDRLGSMLDDAPSRALVQALVLGDRSGLTPQQWEVFARTGTSHLIAISGLHVGLVAGLVFAVAGWLWSRSARLMHRLATPRAAALAALAAALAYAGLAGFAISTQRALVMLAVVLLALLVGRTLRPASALVLALVAVLLLDPSSVLSYGFWLSFGAVAVLLYALGQRVAPPFALLRWGRAQWAVALGLLPMLLLFFGRASLVAPFVNLVAVPLFGILLPVVLVAAAVALSFDWALPLSLVGLLLDKGYGLLAAIAASPEAAATLSGRPDWVWAAALGGVLVLLAPRGLPARWLGLVLLLPLAAMRLPAPDIATARFTLLDVGQGLSAVVRTHAHTLVYDLGPRYPSGFETGSAVVAPYLREIGVDAVDVLIASHADQDHVGGLPGLLNAFAPKRIISGEPGELVDVEAEPCRAGDSWSWDGVRFDVLHPHGRGYEGNDASCVLRVATAGASVLLPGDIGQGVERRLAAEHGGRDGALRATVLVASHHGSATSTSSELLDAVSPRWVLFAAGYRNRYGFPAQAVRQRVEALGSSTAMTAADGALDFLLPATGEMPPPRRWRVESRRVWRHLPSR